MKQLLILILITIQLISCNDSTKSEERHLDSDPAIQLDTLKDSKTTNDVLLFDEGLSYFEVSSGDLKAGFNYKIVETNYDLVFIAPLDGNSKLQYYLAKYTTTTKSCNGCEGHERNIKVKINSFDNPTQTILEIDKDTDKVNLNLHNYETITYGCCGAEDNFEIFDYNHKSIIQSYNQILLGSVPNSKIKFYVGYYTDAKEPSYLGSLMISYNSSEKYIIHLKKVDKNFDEFCTNFSPEIEIMSESKSDKFSMVNNEFTFWSLNKIDNKNQINNLQIKLSYDCDERIGKHTIVIPIINGLPFGKDIKEQEISFGQK